MTDLPVRVLHVLGSLDRGGAETWIVQLLESLDRERIQTDILVHRKGGAYEARARSLGAGIYFGEQPRRPLACMAAFKRLLREEGPYDVVHSHLQLYSGLVMRTAHRAGVPGRIAHARNSADGKRNTPWRIAYRALMRRWIRRHATHLFAVSTSAGEGAFGKGLVASGECQLLTGIALSPFQVGVDRNQVRAELGIPAGTLVVGHVGSFRRQKNHLFLVEVARHLVQVRPDACLLLIGEGELRPDAEEVVRSKNLAEAVRFLGERSDVPRLLQAMDVLAFPSLYEGLPRVLIEAQAAGLPCVASSSITTEAAGPGNLVQFLGLAEPPQVWAQVVVAAARQTNRAQAAAAAIREFEARGLSIRANAERLSVLYDSIAKRAGVGTSS